MKLNKLKHLNKAYKQAIRKAKREHSRRTCRVGSVNELWPVLKRGKSVRGESFVEFTKADGTSTTNPDEINRELLDHFVPIFQDEQLRRIDILNNGKLEPLNDCELINTIKHSPNKKNPGIDQIDHRVVKYLFKKFTSYFETFYNKLLGSAFFPRVLKRGSMILLQKPGKTKNCSKSLRR